MLRGSAAWPAWSVFRASPGRWVRRPSQNVGAYGQEVKDTIVEVRALDRQTLEEIAFAPAECGFAYRQSRFKGADRDRFIVTSVTYRLDDSGQPQIRYPELRRHVNDDHPTLALCATLCLGSVAASLWSSTCKIRTLAPSAPSS